MQATLDSNEFAFLLHSFNAQKVVGVDNATLFPVDDTSRDAMLDEGFSTLQQHGWLLAEDSKIKTNTHLALMVAVVASPEQTIMLTRYLPDGGKQAITYYLAQGIVVEQFLTSDQQYILTTLDGSSEMIVRLQQALHIPDSKSTGSVIISVERIVFEQAIKQAKSGDLSRLIAVLNAAGLEPEIHQPLAKLVSGLHPIGDLETAVLSGTQLKGWHNLVFLQGQDHSVWLMMQNHDLDSISLQSLGVENFAQLIQATLPN